MTAEHAAAAGGEVLTWIGANLPIADDGTGHIADCGWTDEEMVCGCMTLPGRIADLLVATRQAAADAVLAEARSIASAHHVASAEHGRIVALGERLARAARGEK